MTYSFKLDDCADIEYAHLSRYFEVINPKIHDSVRIPAQDIVLKICDNLFESYELLLGKILALIVIDDRTRSDYRNIDYCINHFLRLVMRTGNIDILRYFHNKITELQSKGIDHLNLPHVKKTPMFDFEWGGGADAFVFDVYRTWLGEDDAYHNAIGLLGHEEFVGLDDVNPAMYLSFFLYNDNNPVVIDKDVVKAACKNILGRNIIETIVNEYLFDKDRIKFECGFRSSDEIYTCISKRLADFIDEAAWIEAYSDHRSRHNNVQALYTILAHLMNYDMGEKIFMKYGVEEYFPYSPSHIQTSSFFDQIPDAKTLRERGINWFIDYLDKASL